MISPTNGVTITASFAPIYPRLTSAPTQEHSRGPMSDEETPLIGVLRASDVVAEKVRPVFREPGVRMIRRRVIEDLEQLDIAVNTARSQAEMIVKEAQQTASDIREAAHLDGRSEGLKEVLVELARARKVYANALDTAEKDMVELAFRLAARIIGDSV